MRRLRPRAGARRDRCAGRERARRSDAGWRGAAARARRGGPCGPPRRARNPRPRGEPRGLCRRDARPSPRRFRPARPPPADAARARHARLARPVGLRTGAAMHAAARKTRAHGAECAQARAFPDAPSDPRAAARRGRHCRVARARGGGARRAAAWSTPCCGVRRAKWPRCRIGRRTRLDISRLRTRIRDGWWRALSNGSAWRGRRR